MITLFENLQLLKENDSSLFYNGKLYSREKDLYDLYKLTADKINNMGDFTVIRPILRKYDHRGILDMPLYTRGLNYDKYPEDISVLVRDTRFQRYLYDDNLLDVIEDLININKDLDNIDLEDLKNKEIDRQNNKNNLKKQYSYNENNPFEYLNKKYLFKESTLYINVYNNNAITLSTEPPYNYEKESIISSYTVDGYYTLNNKLPALLKDANLQVIDAHVNTRSNNGSLDIYRFNNNQLNNYVLINYINHGLYIITHGDYIKTFKMEFDNTVTKLDNASDEIKELANILGMNNEGVKDTRPLSYNSDINITFHSLYSKPIMSYGSGFKYNNIFSNANRDILKKCRESIPKKFYNKIWQYNEDPNILLVSMKGFNFLTTKDMFFEDLEDNKNIIQN